MNGTRDEDEDEDVGVKTRKAWFAGHNDAESFGGGFRGTRPAPHGGAINVTPDETAGSYDLCWCGLPFNHDWPGKDAGRKHPRKEVQMPETETATETQPRIERRALRAYHADLADIILSAVNDYGVKYRVTAHSVILFPLDGSRQYAINARNGDRQVKPARAWFVRHCVPLDKPIKDAAKPALSTKPVDEATVKELAEMLNSEEHVPPPDEPAKHEAAPADPPQQPVPSMVATKKAPAKKAVAPPVEEPTAADFAGVQGVQPSDVTAAEEWVPYVKSKSQVVHPDFLLNEATGQVKCKKCGDILAGRSSTAGHMRTHHSDTSTLWGPKAKNKAVTTYFTNKAKGQVEQAIGILQEAMGIEPPKVDISEMEAEVKSLKAQVKELSGGSAEVKDLKETKKQLLAENAELKAKLADIETKQALAREALGL